MKDDTISRAAAIDAVNNMIRRKFGISADLGTGALLELPSATDTNVGGNLIDRQAAIKAADSIIERDTSGNNDVVKAMTAWKEYIKELPSVTPKQPGWIPVTERLPKDDGDYLVTKKSFGWNCKEYIEIDIARYENKDGWHKADTVLAWCELPTPYREGGQDEAEQ